MAHFLAHDKQIPWKSGSSSSISDYVFCNSAARPFITGSLQHYISMDWKDHTMLSFSYESDCVKGSGSWKANIFLAQQKKFRSELAAHLSQLSEDFELIKSFSSLEQLWD
jgi:hypothetical protein